MHRRTPIPPTPPTQALGMPGGDGTDDTGPGPAVGVAQAPLAQHAAAAPTTQEEELPPPRRAYGTFLLADDEDDEDGGLLGSEPTGRWGHLQQRLAACVGHTVVRASAVFIAGTYKAPTTRV